MRINSPKKICLVFLSIFACYFFAAPKVMAIGLITKPIEIDNALRQGEYENRLTLINSENKKVLIKISSEGEIKDWISFYENGALTSSTSVDSISKKIIDVIFKIPSDIPNGSYSGLISVAKQVLPNEKSTTSVSISEKISRTVSIRVSDIEDIKFTTAVIPEKFDLEKNENLILKIIYANSGNIVIRPQVEVKVVQAEKTIYNSIFPYPNEAGIKPLSQAEMLEISIPQNGLQKGNARAEIIVTYNNIEYHKETIAFSVGLDKKQILGASEVSVLPGYKKFIFAGIFGMLFIVLTIFMYFVKSKKSTRVISRYFKN